MFSAATSFNTVISKWDVSLFSAATSFDAGISKWAVSDVFGGDIV